MNGMANANKDRNSDAAANADAVWWNASTMCSYRGKRIEMRPNPKIAEPRTGSIQCVRASAVQPDQKTPIGIAMEPMSMPGMRYIGLVLPLFCLVNFCYLVSYHIHLMYITRNPLP